MRLLNRGSYQKRGFLILVVWCGCFRFVVKKDFFFRFVCKFCYKNDFLKEIKRFCNHFPQKLKGF